MTNRTDTFNRADSTTSLGTPSDGGSAWVADSGTWGITANQVYKVASATTFEIATLEASVSSVEVQATATTPAGNKITGLCVRVASDTDYLMVEAENSGANTNAYLYKKVANSFTQLATTGSFTLALNDVLKLRVDATNQLTFYQNGTQILSANEAAGSTNTKHGVLGYDVGSSGSTLLDEFSITALSIQTLRPSSDVTDGAWTPSTGADNYAVLDEVVADDADYSYTLSASAVTVALSTGVDPVSSADHKVRYRIRGTGDIVVALMQGASTIASWAHAPAPASFTTYEQTLSGGEADSITDYSDLRLEFTAS